MAAAQRLVAALHERIEAGLECELHDHPLPCGNCLGMLYEQGEVAEQVRLHYASLGPDGLRLRPDLAIKRQIRAAT
ncbi:hypothetical protein SAMN05421803_1502 [Nocardiopsis flavescens]|uniref:Uncharacterized protein n=1 Tax=Nocardiopsis flavescens TaxID=758803 RepID=A0A1M6WSH6_9ACTN|nr:hypothetical protein [Nocardiopsis flavescens]SHK96722.1 hypothetical protein SAMN05421803_1502 [Nocardiopsis flavescens]